MASNRWLGVAKVSVARKAFFPVDVTPGSNWRLRVGTTNIGFQYDPAIIESSVSDTDRAQAVVDGLVSQLDGGQLAGGSLRTTGSVSADLIEGKWAVLVTGSDDGAPVDVEMDVAEASESSVLVVEMQKGQAAASSIQTITWPKTPTGGNLTVGYENDEDSVAYNASAATLQTALEGLASIGAGNVSVSGTHSSGYTVTFQGALAGQKVSKLFAYSDDAEGTAAARYEKTTVGGVTRTTIEMAALSGNTNDLYYFTFNEEDSHYFSAVARSDDILSALESIDDLDSNVQVVKNDDGTFTIKLVAEYAGLDAPELSVTPVNDEVTAPALTTTAGTTEPVKTVVTVSVVNLPRFPGTIEFIYENATRSFSLNGLTAADITNDFSSSGVPWTCSEINTSSGGVWTFVFESTVSYYDAGIITADVSSLTGCYAIDVTETTAPKVARNEIQQVTLGSDPDGGTFTLTFDGETTSAIAYNASASTVEGALDALSSTGLSDVTVDGPDGGPWIVTFRSGLGASDQPLITGSGASLTIDEDASVTEQTIQSPTGPNWWGNPANWSEGTIPDGSDTAIFDAGSIPCIYGTENATVGGIDVYRSYNGRIGLPEFREDGSPETLPQFLSLSDTGSKISIRIGLGEEGQGPSVVRIDTQSQESDINVYYSQQPQADERYTVAVAGDIANLLVNNASVSVALASDLTATVDSLRLSATQDQSEEAVLEWGAGAAITYAEVVNGIVRGGAVPTAMTVLSGEASVAGSGTCNQLVVREAVVRYLASGAIGKQGTITAIDSNSGELQLTSAGHGLSSGDKVFVRGLPSIGVEDGYYVVQRDDADNFTLLGTSPAIPFGASTPSTLSSYYDSGTAEWGLVATVRLGSNGTLDFSQVGEERTVVAPILLQSETAEVIDPQVTIQDLRLQSDPSFLDERFGPSGLYRREQDKAQGFYSSSYSSSGVV